MRGDNAAQLQPCGVCLDTTTPILTRHAERLYSWISDVGIVVVPEVLLAPRFIGGTEPHGTVWVVSEIEGAVPKTSGYGSRLITGTISEFGGTVSHGWHENGLVVTIDIPVDQLGACYLSLTNTAESPGRGSIRMPAGAET